MPAPATGPTPTRIAPASPTAPTTPGRRRISVLLLVVATLSACSDDGTGGLGLGGDGESLEEICQLETEFLADGGVGRDGIPALTDPQTVPATSSSGLEFLTPGSRVLAFEVNGQAYAVPHNILWFHEIVNLNMGGERLAATYCPLTGSTLVFDRSSVDGRELGVSGLLFKNNLVMFDRGEGSESLWPQMLAEARCGQEIDTELAQWPAGEMRWDAWRSRHPDGMVVSRNTGFGFDYSPSNYPYGNYEALDNPEFHFPMPALDSRRPPKERVVGVPPTASDPGIALPFGSLTERAGDYAAAEFTYDGSPAVVLWSDEAQGGRVFRPRTGAGEGVTLEATDAGIVDRKTGSRWRIEGRAVSGARAGAELVAIEEAYVAFWGAWAAFFPETRLWPEE